MAFSETKNILNETKKNHILATNTPYRKCFAQDDSIIQPTKITYLDSIKKTFC